ncbi:MAG: phosphotransferase [Clostridia bacterium]|nr:phosphotransferase [Clostridia bacterium]
MNLEKVIVKRDNKTIYRDGDLKIKVFDECYTKAEVLNEALNQARVEETGLNVPAIVGIECVDGKWAIVSEYITGKTLKQLLEENPDKEDEYVELMVNLHIDIFNQPCRIMNRLSDKLSGKIMESDLDAITRFDMHRKIVEMPTRTKICHGDFTPSNITVAEDGKVYIIDWSHAAQGNASADVVRTCLLLRLSGREEMAKKYFDLYCEKNGADRDYAKRWFPIVAAALSTDATGEDKKKLLGWIEKSDF